MRDGFYDENRARNFPLQAGLTGFAPPSINPVYLRYLPLSTIVDFGSTFGLDSGYDEEVDSVSLHDIRREGDTFYFTFRNTATTQIQLVFTRTLGGPMYEVEYVEASWWIGESQALCDDNSIWQGFLVTGSLDELAAILESGHSLSSETDGIYVVEPALNRSRVAGYARAYSVANADRTRATSAAGCAPLNWPFDIKEAYVQGTCYQGDLRFKPGYNSVIRVDATNNALVFSGKVGAGEGQPCDEVPLFDGEAPPDGSELLTGGPTCGETIRSINGIGGPNVEIVAGNGVSIEPSAETHTIIVDVNLNAALACQDVNGPADECDGDYSDEYVCGEDE